jgi:hypothetical protein
MGHEDFRSAGRQQHFHDLRFGFRIEIGGDLIEKQQPRPPAQGASDQRAATLTGRKDAAQGQSGANGRKNRRPSACMLFILAVVSTLQAASIITPTAPPI